MKLKPALLATAILAVCSAAAHAGPSVTISIGPGGCYQGPVFCPPRPFCQRPFYPAYCAPVVYYYNPAPAYYDSGMATRFSTVSGFVNGGQGAIQVSQPVFPVQPVTVYQGNSFRWR